MIDIIIILIYMSVAVAIALTAWSMVRRIQTIGRISGKRQGIPVTLINVTVNAVILLVLILTLLFGDTTPLQTANDEYNDAFWLSVTNMFVTTGMISLFLAVIVVVVAALVLGSPVETLRSLFTFSPKRRKKRRTIR